MSSPILLTAEMSNAFCRVTGDIEQFHLHEKEAKTSFFGRRVAPGLLTTSLTINSMWEMHKKNNLFVGYEVINLKFESKYVKPVEIGDSIRFKWTQLSFLQKKLSGRDALVCDWRVEVFNSDGQTISVHCCQLGYVPTLNSYQKL